MKHIGTITVYPYRKVPFIDYAQGCQGYDACIQLSLPPELVRLLEQQAVRIIPFTGDMGHDSRVWVSMKRGEDNFRTFIRDCTSGAPVIFLFPEHLLEKQRKSFRSDGILFNEYGTRSTISDKLCTLGVYYDATGICCTVLPAPTGLN